ncbi:hypothetical protein [Dysgonomonas termitidis]|uniref:Uncharacterized protein n=1 Tax=Dysgonomonas termitidis TaxID=1516126 RepID=A0ABV9L0Y8_9BACT
MEDEEKVMAEEVVTEPEEQPLRGRSRMMDYLKSNSPDMIFESDDDAIDHILDRYGKVNDTSNKLAEGVRKNPRNAALLQSIMSGNNMLPDIVKMYGKSILELDPESEEFKEIIQAEDERMKSEQDAFDRTAKQQQEFEDNISKSEEVFKAFAENNGMTEEQFSEFLQWAYDTIYMPAFSGVYSTEGLEALKKAYDYDTDVDSAIKAGEAKGRTQKIVEKVRNDNGGGDGVPTLGATSGKPQNKPEERISTPRKNGSWGTNTELIK